MSYQYLSFQISSGGGIWAAFPKTKNLEWISNTDGWNDIQAKYPGTPTVIPSTTAPSDWAASNGYKYVDPKENITTLAEFEAALVGPSWLKRYWWVILLVLAAVALGLGLFLYSKGKLPF